MTNTPEVLGQYLQQLIDRHRKDLSIFLHAYGIDEEPTPMLLVKCYAAHGDAFIALLTGLGEEAFADMPTLQHAEGGGLFGKVSDLFQKAKAVVSGVKAATQGTQPADAEVVPDPPKEEEKKITTKKIVLFGGIAIVVLIIIIIVIKKLKK